MNNYIGLIASMNKSTLPDELEYLLNQDGTFLLQQDNSKIIIET